MFGRSSTKLYVPALGRLYEALTPYAYPLLRFSAGAIVFPHGCQKLLGLFGGAGIAGTAAFFEKIGIVPAYPMAVLVTVVEFFGGACVAIGLLTRPWAVALFIEMMVLVFTVHLPNGFFWNNRGIEYPLLWGIVFLVIAIRGGNGLSVDQAIGREF